MLDAVDAAELGVDAPDILSWRGLKALRKSVYANGGVMGVLRSSSCLMKSPNPFRGLRADAVRAESSDGNTSNAEVGNVEVFGVCNPNLGRGIAVTVIVLSTMSVAMMSVEYNECLSVEE